VARQPLQAICNGAAKAFLSDRSASVPILAKYHIAGFRETTAVVHRLLHHDAIFFEGHATAYNSMANKGLFTDVKVKSVVGFG